MLEQVVGGQFKLVNKLPKGCNSQHFEAVSIQDGKQYMVKAQASDQDALIRQATIYLDLQEKTSILLECGLSRCYYAGKQGQNMFIVLDSLGSSLEVKLKQCQSFRPKTFLTLADQMLKRLEYLHRKGYIHRNIELSKLLMGKDHYSQRLFLVGLTRGKAWNKNGKHIKYAEGRKMRGNALYQSINAHFGLQLSRRDDLQSLIYCWAKMLYGKLPWQDEHNLQKMLSKKMQNRPALLFKNFPKQLAAIHEQIINLPFDGQPNYDNMRCLINELFQHYKIEPDYFYDWDELDLAKNKFKTDS